MVAGKAPSVVFALAQTRYATTTEAIPPAVFAELNRAFVSEPLAEDPFLYEAKRRIKAGRGASAITLLEEARRRNPRHRAARLLLVDRYLRAGNISGATTEISVLSRLIPATGGQLALAVAPMLLDPELRPAVVRALAADPLYDQTLNALARQGADPDVIIALARQQVRAQPPRPGEGDWKPLLVARLVEQRRYTRARQLWAAFGGLSGGSAASAGVYDGRFLGKPGGAPFNWEFTASELGAAERASGGGIDVDYYGRLSGPLARQLILLPPGRYRLSFRSEGSANAQGSRLVWRVACDGAQGALAETVVRAGNAPKVVSADFAIPSSTCPAQWLSLEGVAAEFPATQSTRISAVDIQPLGGAR